jgi:glucose/arabinose dehydrogenase
VKFNAIVPVPSEYKTKFVTTKCELHDHHVEDILELVAEGSFYGYTWNYRGHTMYGTRHPTSSIPVTRVWIKTP